MKVAKHPTLNILVREDGAVLLPPCSRHKKQDWTFGRVNKQGYMEIKFMYKNYRVHKLLAETFIKNPNGYKEVDHINRNRTDNRLQNLRWLPRLYTARKISKSSLEKKRILRRISTNSRSEYVRRNQVLPDVRAKTLGGESSEGGQMKTLTLPLKKQWFDMIKAGIKKEEYREIKPHYIRQFIKFEPLKNDLIRDYNFYRGFDEGEINGFFKISREDLINYKEIIERELRGVNK